ncbi:hypothetical protein FB451DRAFT_1373257 [Mycena latifolia]|nr:hypothetical protein FB451DRAFT_1373257 [Mycena latifolia]
MSTMVLSHLDVVNLRGDLRAHSIPFPIRSEFDCYLSISLAPASPIIGLLRPQIVELLRVENPKAWVSSPDAKSISFGAAIDTREAHRADEGDVRALARHGHFAVIIGPINGARRCGLGASTTRSLRTSPAGCLCIRRRGERVQRGG